MVEAIGDKQKHTNVRMFLRMGIVHPRYFFSPKGTKCLIGKRRYQYGRHGYNMNRPDLVLES